MSNVFKAGDRVVRTREFHSWALTKPPGITFEKGKVYTVLGVSHRGAWLAIEGLNNSVSSDGLPFSAANFRLANYSEYFTEQQAKAPLLLGHVADSPIQKHSVGDFYPLAVVGYGQGDKVRYVVEDLTAGAVLCFPKRLAVRQWFSASDAERYLTGKTFSGAAFGKEEQHWAKARPVFNHNGNLVLPSEPPERKVHVVYEKQDNIIEINGAYYKALEQDIG